MVWFKLSFGLLALCLCGAMIALPARVGATIGIIPANPRNDNERSQSIFVYEIEPSKSQQDAVIITNASTQEVSVELYPTDASISMSGTFSCKQKVEATSDAGAWVTFDTKTITLAPNSSQNVGFNVNVPSDAGVGEHNACIVVAAVEPPKQSGQPGVTLSFRSAIRLAVTVPGEIIKKLTITSVAKKVTENKVLVASNLKNDGNVSLDTHVQAVLKSRFNQQKVIKRVVVMAGRGSIFRHEFDRPALGGWYRLDITAAYDDDANASLGERSRTSKKLYATKTIFILPHPAILVGVPLLLIAIITVVVLLIRRQMRHKRQMQHAKIHEVTKGQDIITIGQLYAVSWKRIARLNKLKKPYNLSKGQKLLVVSDSFIPPKQTSYLGRIIPKWVKMSKHKDGKTK